MVNAEVCFFRELEDCWVSYWMLLGCYVHAKELANVLAFYDRNYITYMFILRGSDMWTCVRHVFEVP
jgi:hypothetical protein